MFLPKLQQATYKRLLKPILFRFDPERVHDRFIKTGIFAGSPLIRWIPQSLFNYQHPALTQELHGLRFRNPVGLAAGFDKNADLIPTIPAVGFGFHEIGSITGEPCPGNPGTRLWRMKKSQGIVVYYGLKNDGCEVLAQKVATKKRTIPLAISVAKTNSENTVDLQAGIADYAKAFENMEPVADMIVINISCPNAFGGEPFSAPERLDRLLDRLDHIGTQKPIFIKLTADLSSKMLDPLIATLDQHRVHGIIATNLTKNRALPTIHDQERTLGQGGVSGKPVFALSNQLISELYQRAGDRYTIIGLGGIFTAEDAYEKIKRGASLVQLITGMIFEGPQLIGQINHGLVERLKADDYTHISQAVGAYHRKNDMMEKN